MWGWRKEGRKNNSARRTFIPVVTSCRSKWVPTTTGKLTWRIEIAGFRNVKLKNGALPSRGFFDTSFACTWIPHTNLPVFSLFSWEKYTAPSLRFSLISEFFSYLKTTTSRALLYLSHFLGGLDVVAFWWVAALSRTVPCDLVLRWGALAVVLIYATHPGELRIVGLCPVPEVLVCMSEKREKALQRGSGVEVVLTRWRERRGI